MNYKLIIAGIILIAAITFGFWFWGQLAYNQEELSNTPLTENQDSVDQTDQTVKSEDSASLETELDSINVEGLDSEQLDLTGL